MRAATQHGEFCFTLTVTDIATGWTLNASVQEQGSDLGLRGDRAGHRGAGSPSPVRGIGSDNGSEFINAHLLRLLLRPEDHLHPVAAREQERWGSHVEQKNWTHVAELSVTCALTPRPSSPS